MVLVSSIGAKRKRTTLILYNVCFLFIAFLCNVLVLVLFSFGEPKRKWMANAGTQCDWCAKMVVFLVWMDACVYCTIWSGAAAHEATKQPFHNSKMKFISTFSPSLTPPTVSLCFSLGYSMENWKWGE